MTSPHDKVSADLRAVRDAIRVDGPDSDVVERYLARHHSDPEFVLRTARTRTRSAGCGRPTPTTCSLSTPTRSPGIATAWETTPSDPSSSASGPSRPGIRR